MTDIPPNANALYANHLFIYSEAGEISKSSWKCIYYLGGKLDRRKNSSHHWPTNEKKNVYKIKVKFHKRSMWLNTYLNFELNSFAHLRQSAWIHSNKSICGVFPARWLCEFMKSNEIHRNEEFLVRQRRDE